MYVKVILVLTVFFVTCRPQQQQQIDLLDQKILALHDEVMPRMGEVLTLRKKIQEQKAASCKDTLCRDTLQALSYQLTKADADMMKWMRTYRKPEVGDSAISYLENQLVEIEKVKGQIVSSMANSTAFLNSGYPHETK